MLHQVHQGDDVTPAFTAAWDRHRGWSRPQVSSLVDRLQRRLEGAWTDWEPGDEEWARVLIQKQPVILVCSRMPLVVTESAVLDHVRNDFSDELVVLTVPSLSTPMLKIDRRVAEVAFGRELSDNVDWDRMSANDFWWATV